MQFAPRTTTRKLLLVTAIVALVLGIVLPVLRRARAQQTIVAAFLDARATVYFEAPRFSARKYTERENSLRTNLLHQVAGIDLSYCNNANRVLPLVAKLPALRYVNLARTGTDSATLRSLKGKAWVRYLNLSCTNVGGDALPLFGEFASVIDLEIGYTKVDDADMAAIAQIPELERLVVSGSRVTDAGVSSLKAHQTLRILELDGTGITDACIKSVATIPRLQSLSVSGTRVTSLNALCGMKSLQDVDARNTPIANEDITVLQRAVPECVILVGDRISVDDFLANPRVPPD